MNTRALTQQALYYYCAIIIYERKASQYDSPSVLQPLTFIFFTLFVVIIFYIIASALVRNVDSERDASNNYLLYKYIIFSNVQK